MWYGTIYLEYCPGGSYACPPYCKAEHIHLTEDCNENKEKQEAYKQRIKDDVKRTEIQSDGDTIASNEFDGNL